jgi:hypothetical protein
MDFPQNSILCLDENILYTDFAPDFAFLDVLTQGHINAVATHMARSYFLL